jgi:phosphoglycerate dehydrogenase-like enzyme
MRIAFSSQPFDRDRSCDVLFAEADNITLLAPLTPERYHMVDAGAVARVKRGVRRRRSSS